MKQKKSSERCLICDSPMMLALKVGTTQGQMYLCKDCMTKLYREIGKTLTPISPVSIFKERK